VGARWAAALWVVAGTEAVAAAVVAAEAVDPGEAGMVDVETVVEVMVVVAQAASEMAAMVRAIEVGWRAASPAVGFAEVPSAAAATAMVKERMAQVVQVAQAQEAGATREGMVVLLA